MDYAEIKACINMDELIRVLRSGGTLLISGGVSQMVVHAAKHRMQTKKEVYVQRLPEPSGTYVLM